MKARADVTVVFQRWERRRLEGYFAPSTESFRALAAVKRSRVRAGMREHHFTLAPYTGTRA